VPVPYRDRCVYIPENAVDPAALPAVRRTPPRRPLRVAFAGRLVPYKGADMLIEAAAPLVRSGRVVLDIIGDGPQMKLLRAFVAREEIERGVRFAGWLDHAQVPARLARSDVFGFPSIREFGGAVVLEAMALGLVPLVVDYGGPAEFVTPSTGRTVPVGAARDIVRGFRRELERMVADPGELQAFGDRARRRVLTYFTWPVKAQQVVEVYRWVLGRRGKPDFGMPFPDMVLEAPGRDAAGQGQAAAPRAAGSG
jgi:glycosyltransferase involved in cell wall biosynthesis